MWLRWILLALSQVTPGLGHTCVHDTHQLDRHERRARQPQRYGASAEGRRLEE